MGGGGDGGQSLLSKSTGVSQSTASKLTISSFCSDGIDFSDERATIPDQVKEIVQYLGINQQALLKPVTPAEVADMAGYLGVNVVTEGFLLPLVKLSLFAPLPKHWEIYKDDRGELFYFNRVSKQTTYRHPADDYFARKIAEERVRFANTGGEPQEPWLEFKAQGAAPFWYNFATGERRSTRPADA